MVRQFRTGLLTAIAVVTVSATAGGEVIDRVLAVVSGQLITLSDVVAARDLGLQTAEGAADPLRAILTKLIDREIVLGEVERYTPQDPASSDILDGDVARVRARFASPAAFEATLARSGIDEKHLRETLRQDRRVAAYLDQRFATGDERRTAAIDEWLAGLRRRTDVIDLYQPGR